jgi:lysozyme
MRTINLLGLNLIKNFEGLRQQAYRDPAGILTIGYGHTLNVTPEEVINEATASALLTLDLEYFEELVESVMGPSPTTENQFSAFVSLCFNIGNNAFKSSSALCYHKDGLYLQAADSFLLWNKAHVNGSLVKLPGLIKRREAERTLYLLVSESANLTYTKEKLLSRKPICPPPLQSSI